MCPGPSRTTRRPPNRTRLPHAREPVPRPGRPGTTSPARRRRPSRHPCPGAAPHHRDPVLTVRPRPSGGRSRVPPPARPARPPRPLASPDSRSPRPAGRPPGPGGLVSPAIHAEASRQRIRNARREKPATSPQRRAGRPSASGCGAEGHTGADPAATAGTLAPGGGRLPSAGQRQAPCAGQRQAPAPGNGGQRQAPCAGQRQAPLHRSAAGYPAPGSGGSSPDFS